jgi:hypothetical protein
MINKDKAWNITSTNDLGTNSARATYADGQTVMSSRNAVEVEAEESDSLLCKTTCIVSAQSRISRNHAKLDFTQILRDGKLFCQKAHVVGECSNSSSRDITGVQIVCKGVSEPVSITWLVFLNLQLKVGVSIELAAS